MIGGSSLLVLFATLALTVFTLLSLTTVQADERLSETAAQTVLDYYAADCAAQEILARLRSGEAVDGVTETDGVYAYQCPISESQTLEVQVTLDGQGGCAVLRWQAVPAGAWSPDNSLEVWDGIS